MLIALCYLVVLLGLDDVSITVACVTMVGFWVNTQCKDGTLESYYELCDSYEAAIICDVISGSLYQLSHVIGSHFNFCGVTSGVVSGSCKVMVHWYWYLQLFGFFIDITEWNHICFGIRNPSKRFPWNTREDGRVLSLHTEPFNFPFNPPSKSHHHHLTSIVSGALPINLQLRSNCTTSHQF